MGAREKRRNAKTRVGPALFFIAVIVGAACLSLWIEDRYRKAEGAYRLYLAQHPLKPGERPPKIDWLTGKVWR